MLIDRPNPTRRIREALAVHPCAALTGPRQCGKTTLARQIAAEAPGSTYFNLEAAVDRQRLAAPEQALGRLGGLVVIDEVQRMPSLFETVRVLVDRPGNTTRFLLLGSASARLVKGVPESLAGRVGLVDLGGFDLAETRADAWRKLWDRGGFPRAFLAPSGRASSLWRRNFVRTFLERDIPQLGIRIPAESLRRFWTMVAHCHGQSWNAAELARALGSSQGTARRYLDILAGAFMVRVLPPWFENLTKRQVKAPKVYVRDTGLLHTLLGISGESGLRAIPRSGPRSRDLSSSSCWVPWRRGTRTTGRPTPARSSISSFSAQAGGTGSSAGSPTRPARHGRCVWRSRIWGWTTSGSCIRAMRRTSWTRGSPCSPWRRSGLWKRE